jgi:hypothetical protein
MVQAGRPGIRYGDVGSIGRAYRGGVSAYRMHPGPIGSIAVGTCTRAGSAAIRSTVPRSFMAITVEKAAAGSVGVPFGLAVRIGGAVTTHAGTNRYRAIVFTG